MRCLPIAFGFAAMLLSGCTTSLSTKPTYEVTTPEQALTGIAYSLPMLQYDMALSYELATCDGADAAGNPTQPSFKVEATAASDYVPGESYTINYRKLTNVFKVTDFSIETYPSGTLKAMNASVEDKSADIIKSAVELGITGVSLAAGKPPAPGVAMADREDLVIADEIMKASKMKRLICKAAAKQNLIDAKAARDNLETITDQIEGGTKIIDAITVRATNKLSAAGDRKLLLTTHQAQLGRLVNLAAAEESVAKAEKGLSLEESRLWPLTSFTTEGSVGQSGVLAHWLGTLLDWEETHAVDAGHAYRLMASYNYNRGKTRTAEELEKLKVDVKKRIDAEIVRQASYDRKGLCSPVMTTAAECAADKVGVYAELISDYELEPGFTALPACKEPATARTEPCITSAGTIAARKNVSQDGIFIRQAARAKLFLCNENRSCHGGDRKPLHTSDWVTTPQLGQLRFIPFTNGPFQNNALNISLAEDGTITKMQYAEKSAILAGVLATASSAAKSYQAYEKDREAERKQAIADARAETTYQRGEIAYQRAETNYQRSEVSAARTEEIAALQFQIDKLAKDKQLNDLLHPAPAVDPIVATDYANETIRLNAVAAQLQAKLAILEAQRALDAK